MPVRIIAILLCLLGNQAVFAAEPFPLVPGQGSNGAIGQFAAFNDTLEATANINELESAPFTDVAMDVPNFGLNRGPIWLRVDLENSSSANSEWLLSLNRALLDSMRVLLATSGSAQEIFTQSHRLTSYREFGTLAVPFSIAGSSTATMYVLYEGSNSSILPLTIETRDSIASQQLWDLIIFFVSLAGVATLIVYNTVLGLITRLSAFLYYGLAQIVLFSYFTHLSGMTTIYLWPETPEIGSSVAPVLAVMSALFSSLFLRSFIETSQLPRWLNLSFSGIIYGSVAALALMLPTSVANFATVPLNILAVLFSLLTAVLLPVAGTLTVGKDQLRYLPMTAAWYWFGASVIYTTLTAINLAPVIPEFLTVYVGFAFGEAILLSVSLALEVRHINLSRMRAQHSLAESLSAQLEESRRNEKLMSERSMALSDLADRGRMLQAAGHDTRQALFALKQFASGLHEKTSPERLQKAQQSITQLAKHVDDVLATTLVGAHGGAMIDQVLALEKVAVSNLLEPIRLIYQRTALKKNLKFKIYSRDACVVTDRVLLIRILSNLVGNAIKYTERGGVLIGCRVFANKICFQVWDTGIGMSYEQLSNLLSERTSSKRFTENEEGLGSGLQTCIELARKLKLKFSARSKVSRGSVFEIEIETSEPGHSTSPTCYILDNDQLSRKWLESAGWQVDDELPKTSRKPVFIDFDYRSPAGGIATALALRAKFRNIVMTSYDHSADIRNACAEVSEFLLYKPLEEATLNALLQRLQQSER